MLLISMLLSGQGRDRKLFLPATIVFGATISTIVVLRKLRDGRHNTLFPSETLEALKQRIENLEAIASSNTGHWEDSLKQLDRMNLDRSR